jgi:hypothetical protein
MNTIMMIMIIIIMITRSVSTAAVILRLIKGWSITASISHMKRLKRVHVMDVYSHWAQQFIDNFPADQLVSISSSSNSSNEKRKTFFGATVIGPAQKQLRLDINTSSPSSSSGHGRSSNNDKLNSSKDNSKSNGSNSGNNNGGNSNSNYSSNSKSNSSSSDSSSYIRNSSSGISNNKNSSKNYHKGDIRTCFGQSNCNANIGSDIHQNSTNNAYDDNKYTTTATTSSSSNTSSSSISRSSSSISSSSSSSNSSSIDSNSPNPHTTVDEDQDEEFLRVIQLSKTEFDSNSKDRHNRGISSNIIFDLTVID